MRFFSAIVKKKWTFLSIFFKSHKSRDQYPDVTTGANHKEDDRK